MAKAAQIVMARERDGQTAFPGTERVSDAEMVRRRAAERMRATVTQRPMDSGLFGDEWKQREISFKANLVASSHGAGRGSSPSPDSSPQSGSPAPTRAATAATIMDAKKAWGVGPKEAVRLIFEAVGLDPENQDHWDTLIGTLTSAQPKKRRGRHQKWTEAEVVEFNHLVAWARAVRHAVIADFGESPEEIRSKSQLHERVAFVRLLLEKLAQDPDLPPHIFNLTIRYALKHLTDEYLPIGMRAPAEKRHRRPDVFDAMEIAKILQYTQHYQHISEATLTKYVLSGPVRTRRGK
jgi:hypothetical protein